MDSGDAKNGHDTHHQNRRQHPFSMLDVEVNDLFQKGVDGTTHVPGCFCPFGQRQHGQGGRNSVKHHHQHAQEPQAGERGKHPDAVNLVQHKGTQADDGGNHRQDRGKPHMDKTPINGFFGRIRNFALGSVS